LTKAMASNRLGVLVAHRAPLLSVQKLKEKSKLQETIEQNH